MKNNERKKNPWLIVTVLVFCTMIATFNETILNVALLPVAKEMSVSTTTAQWLITCYMLISTVMVPVTAFLYQSIPTKRLSFGAMGILLIGSVGCYFAPAFPVLLICRMFQAVGASMMIPIMMSTALLVTPKEKLGTVMALCVCGTTLGPAFGPTISGTIIKLAGWRAVFIFIIAMACLALLAISLFIDNVAEITMPHFDIQSVILSTIGLAIFLYGISIIFSNAATGIVLVIVGLILIAVYVKRQMHLRQPMLDMRPFENSMFTVGIVMVFVAMLVSFSLNVTTPTFLQGCFGVSSMISALLLLPGVLLNAVSTNISGKLMDKFGGKWMIPAGFIVTAVAVWIFSLCGKNTSLVLIIVCYCLIFQGIAFTLSPSQTTALSTLSKEMNPHGVGIVNTFMQLAAGIGSSLFGGIQAKFQAASIADGASGTQAIAYGFHGALYAAIVIAAVGFLASVVYFKVKNSGKVQ